VEKYINDFSLLTMHRCKKKVKKKMGTKKTSSKISREDFSVNVVGILFAVVVLVTLLAINLVPLAEKFSVQKNSGDINPTKTSGTVSLQVLKNPDVDLEDQVENK
jgi:hypothetical protein